MSKKILVSLAMILAAFLLVTGESNAKATDYYDPENHYSLTFPDDWEEIPREAIDETVSQLANESVVFEAGFHFRDKDYFEYPYILVQNVKIDTPSYKEIENELAGLRAQMKSELEELEAQYETLVSEATAEKPYLDKNRNMVFVNTEVNTPAVGKVKNLAAICLGSESAIRIFFYSLESEYSQDLPVFMSILDSFKYDQGYEYDESKATANSGSIWEGVLEKGLIGLITGGVVAILFGLVEYLRSKRNKNLKDSSRT